MSSHDRRLAVVSYRANHDRSPRGQRTRAVIARLQADWQVDLVAGPPVAFGVERLNHGYLEKAARAIARSVLIDYFEPWSRTRLRRWEPNADGALLIGQPLSPLVEAHKRLMDRKVPYVLDLGDLAAVGTANSFLTGLGRHRAARAETRLICDARAVVVAVDSQARVVRTLAPGMPVLVRPNGYHTMSFPTVERLPGDHTLRLLHFGSIASIRLDVRPFLNALAQSGHWDRIELYQLGMVRDNLLDGVDRSVEVHHLAPAPISDLAHLIAGCDLALVIGNQHGEGLPSKAVQYLGFPIHRVALVERPDDELARWTSRFPGWVAVRWDAPNPAESIVKLLGTPPPNLDLQPPASESWPVVAQAIADFVTTGLLGSDPG